MQSRHVLVTALALAYPLSSAADPEKIPVCRGVQIFTYALDSPCAGGTKSLYRLHTWMGCDGEGLNPTPGCGALTSADYERFSPGWTPEDDDFHICYSAPLATRVIDTCSAADEPNECKGGPKSGEAAGDPANDVGDPVDLTTGQLEWTPADVDLGAGLRFTRHYASERTAAGEMGKAWRHSLEWSIQRHTLGTGAGAVTAIAVQRPLKPSVVFVQQTQGSSSWVTSARPGATLTGDSAGTVTFTDPDGTVALFAAPGAGKALTEIRPPGQTPITVTVSGAETTYTQGGRSIVVTGSSGRVTTVAAGGESWAYMYDSDGFLSEVTGPDPSTASPTDTISWTYVYQVVSSVKKLQRIDRTVGGGSPVTFASWTWTPNLSHVVSVDEPALEQTLAFSYDTSTANSLGTTVKAGSPSGPTLGLVQSVNGMISSLTQRNCSPRPVWIRSSASRTLCGQWDSRRQVAARSLGSVTVPGFAMARRVASARYAAGSTPASLADSSSE